MFQFSASDYNSTESIKPLGKCSILGVLIWYANINLFKMATKRETIEPCFK